MGDLGLKHLIADKTAVLLEAATLRESGGAQASQDTSLVTKAQGRELSGSEDAVTQTPRSSSGSEDSSECAEDGDTSHNDYYAFLQELAGSFDAGPPNDSDQDDSDSSDQDDDTKCEATANGVTGEIQAKCVCKVKGEAAEGDLPSTGDESSTSRSRGRSSQQVRLPISRSSTPELDSRGPVRDDYDVTQAVANYASERSGDAIDQQVEDLKLAIQLLHSQAEQLRVPAVKQSADETVVSHYAKIREELLQEACLLERQLSQCRARKAIT